MKKRNRASEGKAGGQIPLFPESPPEHGGQQKGCGDQIDWVFALLFLSSLLFGG